MKKRFMALTAGAAAAMMIVTGCSGQADQTATSAPAQTETAAETETGTEKESETETKVSETEGGAEETVEETQQEIPEQSLEEPSVPLKIWGEITEVTDRVIYVDNQSENSSPGEFVLTIDPDTTRILDGESGLPVDYDAIEKGRFEAYLGPAMTMSLPPQALAEMVIVNIKEDAPAAQYVIAAGSVDEKDGVKTLTGKDGTEYALSQEVSIIPYLTRQMVRLEDIGEDSQCLVWVGDEETVERIVLFNQ